MAGHAHSGVEVRPLRLDRRRLRPAAAWLVVPALAFLGVAFAYPVALILSRSFTEAPGGLSHYHEFLQESGYVKVLVNTFRTAALVTVVCLALGYPYAYVMATTRARARQVLLICLLVPLWTSLLVRTYAWLVILDRQGVVNTVLRDLGITQDSLTLVHNETGVLIGMVQILLPLMVLPLFAVVRGIDGGLVKAASSLGASPARAFRDVYVPLSLPGVAAGCLLVFIVSLGYYITPALLGGSGDTMLGELIANQIGSLLNWGLGAAMAAVLLGVTVLMFAVFSRSVRLDRIWGV